MKNPNKIMGSLARDSAVEAPVTVPDTAAALSGPARRLPALSRPQFERFAERYALVGAWIITIVVFSILRPSTFFTTANFETIFGSQSVLVVLTLALTLPLIVGEFDLSIGANMGFAAVFVAVMNTEHGWSIWTASAVACLIGIGIGLINAILVVQVGVDALVATLGMGTLIQGIGYAVTNYIPVAGISESLVTLVSKQVFGLPLSFYYGILLALLAWYLLRFTPVGRYLRFTGAAPEVARLSGLNVRRLKMSAFVICGLVSAISGVLLVGTFGSADPNNGTNFLLPAFAAAFLGATAISPGEFNPWGAVVAVYFLTTGITGLQLLGLQSWIQDVFYGATLVFAVTLARLVARRTR